MTQAPPGSPIPYPESFLFVEGIGLTEADLSIPLDRVATMGDRLAAEAADYLRAFPPAGQYELGSKQLEILQPALNSLAGAIEDGSVLPSEARDAMQWATGRSLGGYLPKDMILNGGLADKLTLWGLDHGRVPVLPSSSTVTAEAKLAPRSRTIKAPGVPHPTVRAITEASAGLWSNVLRLTASLTDQIVSEVRAVGYLASQSRSQAIATEASLNSHVHTTEIAIRALRADLVTAVRELDKLQGGPKPITMGEVLKRVEEYVSHHTTHGTDKVVAGIEAAQKTDVQRLNGQQHEIVKLQTGVAKLEPLLGLAPLLALKGTMQKLPTSLKTLEDCCYANSQVTNPIRAGGATPSLLRQLGGLLKGAAELYFGISIAETITMLLDAPLATLDFIHSAEWVVGYADRAAGVVVNRTGWIAAVANPAG